MILINGTKCTVQKCMAFHCMLNKMVIFIPYHVIIISQLNNEVLYIYAVLQLISNGKSMSTYEAHQGVMTDKRHSLKRGDRLSKKERQTTASDWEKATNCDLCYGSKVTATFVTIKQATKQLQNE